MVDAGIGRLLVASLHQGIADVAPARLPFYEHWLTPRELRSGRLGLASLHAVLSFLRREGQGPYEEIMRRAGTYSGEWGYLELPAVKRALVRRLPRRVRVRAALYLSARLVSETFRGTQARVRLTRDTGTMNLRASVFCAVRETAAWPMCVFYSAAVERFLECCDVRAAVAIAQCQASGGRTCVMTLSFGGEISHPMVEAA